MLYCNACACAIQTFRTTVICISIVRNTCTWQDMYILYYMIVRLYILVIIVAPRYRKSCRLDCGCIPEIGLGRFDTHFNNNKNNNNNTWSIAPQRDQKDVSMFSKVVCIQKSGRSKIECNLMFSRLFLERNSKRGIVTFLSLHTKVWSPQFVELCWMRSVARHLLKNTDQKAAEVWCITICDPT